MADLSKLNKEQKKIIADLHSPDEEIIIETLYRIREVGDEYCIDPMVEVFFTTPFANVRTEIGRVFLDLKSAKVSKQILESLSGYMNHELIGEFISNLWQSSVVFDDVTPFVEKFVNADEIARGLSPFNPESVAIEAGRLMLSRIKDLLSKNESFSIETTLATRSYFRLIEKAHQQGYEVTLLYFWLKSPEQAMERVAERVSSGGNNQERIIRNSVLFNQIEEYVKRRTQRNG